MAVLNLVLQQNPTFRWPERREILLRPLGLTIHGGFVLRSKKEGTGNHVHEYNDNVTSRYVTALRHFTPRISKQCAPAGNRPLARNPVVVRMVLIFSASVSVHECRFGDRLPPRAQSGLVVTCPALGSLTRWVNPNSYRSSSLSVRLKLFRSWVSYCANLVKQSSSSASCTNAPRKLSLIPPMKRYCDAPKSSNGSGKIAPHSPSSGD